jgi:hypothetical protein
LARSAFTFDSSQFKSPQEMEKRLQRALLGVVRYWDGRVEASMKHSAPWNDQTAIARNGLAARGVKLSETLYAIILSHAVTYGIYLERGTRYMAARPVIEPTIRLYGPRVIAFTTKLMNRL